MGIKVVVLNTPNCGRMLDLAPEATEDEATKLLAEIDDSQGRQSRLPGWTALCRPLGAEATARIPNIDVRSDGTYLITGGLGALGLRVARWMVEQGARQLVLTS